MIDSSLLNELYNTTINNDIGRPRDNNRIPIKSTPVVIRQQPQQMVEKVRSEPRKTIEHMSSQEQSDDSSFLDPLFVKKREMVKTIVLVLTVVVALSLHSFFAFWIKNYVTKSRTTIKMEMFIRLSYPVLVLFIIWLTKAYIL
jgi:hypothetical protein